MEAITQAVTAEVRRRPCPDCKEILSDASVMFNVDMKNRRGFVSVHCPRCHWHHAGQFTLTDEILAEAGIYVRPMTEDKPIDMDVILDVKLALAADWPDVWKQLTA